ncbi:hypothetical protein ACN27F_34350 [Solwaraspora sp. WMMB335]|uniref:hypothetical protein n=1 Tax=Solwaraspora sp. WMMB335 TaxID=3404118 RepID=UPI003B93B136
MGAIVPIGQGVPDPIALRKVWPKGSQLLSRCRPLTYALFAAALAAAQFAAAEFIHVRDVGIDDGTFVVVRENGQVYRIAGGAPLHVSSWDAFGGPQPTMPISVAQLNALPYYPADGTFIVGGQTDQIFRVAGGAPLYVSSWVPFGGPQPTVVVDQDAIDNAGSGGAGSPWSHLSLNPWTCLVG